MVTIAIANQKGGTGKTTTVLALGHRLAMDGYRVLLVDADTQGHLAAGLGLDKAPGIRRLVDWREGSGEPLVVSAREGLDLIPSDGETGKAKQRLTGMPFREDFLSAALEEMDGYDVAVIDCAPSVDVLHMAAVVAADWLIVPTRLDYLAVDGVNEVILFLRDVKQYRPGAADLLGILPTFYDRRTNETLVQLRSLVDAFGGLVSPPIPIDVKLREAPAFGKTIWEYAPRTRSIQGITTAKGKVYGGYARFVAQVEEVAL